MNGTKPNTVSFIRFLTMLVFLGCTKVHSNEPKLFTSDICVYGGSEAGFIAAIEAAHLGKTVSLIAPSAHIGGFIINGLSTSDIGNGLVDNKHYVSGLPLGFYMRIASYYGHNKTLGEFGWEPHVAEKIIEDWIKEYPNISVYKKERLKEGKGSVVKEGSVIKGLVMESGKKFKASIFIDATIEGDLMAFSGVNYTFGREGNAKYGETINGVYPEQSYAQFKVNLDPYNVVGDTVSGLIPTILDVPIGRKGEASPYIMGFCFRICLTDNLENQVPISKPRSYNPHDYEIYRRYFTVGGMNGFLKEPDKNVPNSKTDLGSWHDLSANLYGMNVDYPDGSYKIRQKMYECHKNFTLGLLWFLQNDSSVPIDVKSSWKAFGLPKDEFKDNGHWPYKFYARSARRMVSDYVITEHNGRPGAKQTVDPIGITLWPFDMHASKRVIKNGSVWNEGFIMDKKVIPFGISYRALVPKSDECSNLLVPGCPSSSYVGYSALRLTWVFMTMGQAAGAAASIAIDNQIDVQEVPYNKLRTKLLEVGQVLNSQL